MATVTKGSVASTIDAVGTLQYLTSQNLDFPVTGKLMSLNVAVGDHVAAGEELAAVDNTQQRVALRKANDEVARLQAVMDHDSAGVEMDNANKEVAGAGDVIDQQHRVVDDTDASNRSDIRQYRRELDFDQHDLDLKQQQLAQDQANPLCMTDPNCTDDRVNGVQDARHRIIDDRRNLKEAQHRFDADHAHAQADAEQDKLNKTFSTDKRRATSNDHKYSLLEDRAALDSAQADLLVAQKSFNATVMHSSFNGSVFKINHNVGDVVPAALITPLDPASAAAPAAAPQAAATPPAVGAAAQPFMVIKDINSFQVSAPFSAADAARMKPDQPATVTFDAVPGLTRNAKVSSITPADPAVKDSNAIVKLTLTESDPRLADGMTTQAHVIASSTDNVLVLPSGAVHRVGQSGTVTVIGPSGSREVPVELGATGTDTTQIVSGVREGDHVALPGK